MTTVKVEQLTNIGTLAAGDKLLGERVDGTTVRLTYSDVGTTNFTTAGTITTGTWNASTVTVSYGGSGRTSATAYALLCGGTTSTGVHQSMPSGTAGQLLTSAGSSALPAWTTATYPATTTVNQLLYSSAGNTVTGLTTANSGVLVTSGAGVPSISTTLPSGLTIPGYQTTLTYSNGGIVYSGASSLAVLAGTATANKMLLSGSSTTPAWSTSTIPTSSGAAGYLLVSDGTNYVLSTPKFPNASATTRKVMISDGTDWTASTETYAAPGTSGKVMQSDGTNWTSATPTGTGVPVLATSPTLVTPNIGVATGTSFNFITGVATQAELEAATSVVAVVTPGRQRFHPGMAKAWVHTNGADTTIRASHNVSSITDNGSGDFTANFVTAFSSADYAMAGMGGNNTTSLVCVTQPRGLAAPGTGSCRHQIASADGTIADKQMMCIVYYGDQ